MQSVLSCDQQINRDDADLLIIDVPLADLRENPENPRSDVGDLTDLAASVSQHGVRSPLEVRRTVDGFVIISGHRRCGAAKLAGMANVPCIVRNDDHTDSMILALTENLQRADLPPLDVAYAFQRLIERGLKPAELAAYLGISETAVSQKRRLLKLPKCVHVAMSPKAYHGPLSESAALLLLKLSVFDRVATQDHPFGTWLHVYADRIIWGPNWHRTVADVRQHIDDLFATLHYASRIYAFGGMSVEECHAEATRCLDDGVIQELREDTGRIPPRAVLMVYLARPDFSKLTERDHKDIDAAADRVLYGDDETSDEDIEDEDEEDGKVAAPQLSENRGDEQLKSVASSASESMA